MIKKTKCTLCSEIKFTKLYSGKIRDGKFGSSTEKNFDIVKCKGCGLVRLLQNPYTLETYKSEDYRDSYNDSHKAEDYLSTLDFEQPPRLETIGMEACRNKIVLDNGCGAASFLDLLKGSSKKTIGIEPFSGYHSSIKKRGHEIFQDPEEALKKYENKVDLVTSFGVIEHTLDPLKYLKDSYSLLKNNGKMFIETDNNNDILKKIIPQDFNSFFYRTAHLWYFDEKTLKKIALKAGFKVEKIYFRQNFDISNLLSWIKEKKPTGNGKIKIFNDNFNKFWKSFLEEKGIADLVCIELTKI